MPAVDVAHGVELGVRSSESYCRWDPWGASPRDLVSYDVTRRLAVRSCCAGT